jgi:hypothetical protein
VQAKHACKVKSKGIAENHTIDRPMSDNEEVPALLAAKDIFETTASPFVKVLQWSPLFLEP